MKILIKNVTVLTMDQEKHVYKNGYLLTEDSIIKKIGEMKELPNATVSGSADVEIDGREGILLPGFINAHCHVSMIPFRTMGDDCPDRLRRFLFPLENEAMTRRLVYLSARYGIAEMLLAGVTTFVDMYYYEEEVAKACEEMGMRGVLGETVIGQPTCDSKTPYGGLDLAKNFIAEWKNSELVHPIIAPHATNTNSPEMLKRAYEVAEEQDTLFTLHASEMDYELAYFKNTYGKTPIEFLKELGVLGPRTLAAHCIHLTEGDIEILRSTGTSVVHCIGSNTKAGKGVAPVKELIKACIPVGLGTDGPSSGNTLDLFTQFRLFASFHKTVNHDRGLFPSEEIIALGTVGGARSLHMEGELGTLEIGKKADMVLVETESVNMFPCYNPYSALVYSANASNVDTVIVNGRILVREKKLVYADIPTLREELQQEMGYFVKTAENYADIV